MVFNFAHAGEVHEEAFQSTTHLLFGKWYVALGLLVLLLLLVVRITLIVTRGSKSAAYLAVMMTLLLCGMFTYAQSAVISVVSLTVGFVMAIIQVLGSLSSKDTDT